MKRGCILLLLGSALGVSAQHNCAPSDDYGDGPAAASFISFGAARNASIESRNDRDYFCFDADSYAQFLVQVTPIGGVDAVQEAEVRLYNPDGFTRLAKATSTGNRPRAELNFVNAGINRRIYIDVRSFSEYTSGRYQVLVNRTGDPVDTDGDELPDDWETEHSFNKNVTTGIHGASGDPDGDGLTNLDEFRSGTDPRDANSGIQITQTSNPMDTGTISWMAVPYASYKVFRCPTILNPVWTPIATVSNPGTATSLSYTDPAMLEGGPQFLYRVEYVEQ